MAISYKGRKLCDLESTLELPNSILESAIVIADQYGIYDKKRAREIIIISCICVLSAIEAGFPCIPGVLMEIDGISFRLDSPEELLHFCDTSAMWAARAENPRALIEMMEIMNRYENDKK